MNALVPFKASTWRETLRRWWRAADEPYGGTGPAIRPMILAGTAVIVLFFGAFVGWAGTAPITSAAVAPGFVIVDGNRKTVQHLEGGIVARLLVREQLRIYGQLGERRRL